MKLPSISAFLITLALPTASIIAADVGIQSPLDYQVFQRLDQNQGLIRLHGEAKVEGIQSWQYRLSGTALDGAPLPESWRDFPTPLQNQRFDFLTTVPAGGWYRFEIRGLKDGEPAVSSVVPHVGVGEVFLVAGQSNAANHGSEPQKPKSNRIVRYDGKSWALALDPQKGASGSGGSFLPALADALEAKFHVPVGLIPIAAGGTSVREWLPEGEVFEQQTTTGKGVTQTSSGQWTSDGKLFATLVNRLDQLGSHGLRAILWHQGESDAGQAREGHPADRQISGEQYTRFMETLVRASRARAGWHLPWFTAQTTYHSPQDSADTEFREAQSKLWQTGVSLEGPDTDALVGEHRSQIHFSGLGLQKHGQLWADKVSPWLEKQLPKPPPEGPPSTDYKLVWSDEFDGTELDLRKWKHRYPGPRKDGFNDPSAFHLDGQGHLHLSCQRKDDRIVVGMITTDGLYSAKYGYFEARVQFQTQEGWWPGFWLMSNTVGDPDRGKAAVDDTTRNGTEIDIFEYLRIRGDQIQHALHWNGYGKSHKSTGHHAPVPELTTGFHTVGCEWTPESYTFYVDGRKTHETQQAISQIPEYLILSGEVSSWPGQISRARLPDAVIWDYVRVWQKP